jgi:hypothetical protein
VRIANCLVTTDDHGPYAFVSSVLTGQFNPCLLELVAEPVASDYVGGSEGFLIEVGRGGPPAGDDLLGAGLNAKFLEPTGQVAPRRPRIVGEKAERLSHPAQPPEGRARTRKKPVPQVHDAVEIEKIRVEPLCDHR